MSNLITASRRSSFRSCRRKHQLEYLQGYRPVRSPEYFTFGTLLHAGIATWWRAKGATPEERSRLAGLTVDQHPEGDPFVKAKAKAILSNYHLNWPDADEWDVLEVERSWTSELLNPETMRATPLWLMAGAVDLILRHKMTGEVVLVEHKSTADDISDDGADYWRKLTMDGQLTQYVIGAIALGYEISSVLYDVCVRPQLRPKKATPEDERKWTKPTKKDPVPRLYKNQREEDETLPEFTDRLYLDIAARPERYYRRRIIARSEDQVRDGMADLWDEQREMRSAELNERHPRNPDACQQWGTCAFWNVCAQGVDPETSTLFTRLDDVHPELELTV